MAEAKNFRWTVQRVVPTDIGTFTSEDEPHVHFNMNSVESIAGPIPNLLQTENIMQINFKSGKTIYCEIQSMLENRFWDDAFWSMERKQ